MFVLIPNLSTLSVLNVIVFKFKYLIIAFLISFFFLFFYASDTFAATRTWDGGGGDNNWSTAANWSGDSAPTSADIVVFDGTSSIDATINSGFGGTVATVNINVGYTGTVTAARSFSVSTGFSQTAGTFNASSSIFTIGSGGSFSLSNGAFSGGTNTNNFNGTVSISGGTFTSTSGTMAIGGALTYTAGTYTHNSGTVTFNGSATATHSCGTSSSNKMTFNDINISATAQQTFGQYCDLPLGTNTSITGATFHGTISGSGTLTVLSGNTFVLEATGTFSGFSGFQSTRPVNIYSTNANFGSFTTFDINNTVNIYSGASFTAPSGNMSVLGNLNIESGATFTHNSGTLILDGNTNGAILTCNSSTLYNLTFSTGASGTTKLLGSDCTAVNDVTFTQGTLTNPSSAYTLSIQGDFSQTTNATITGGNNTISFTGSGTQTISQGSGSTFSSKFTVNKTGGSADLSSAFTVSGQSCTVVEGVFDLNGNTFVCSGAGVTFIIQDGGTLKIIGSETGSTDPIFQTGSTLFYKGDNDGAADTYNINTTLTPYHLTIAPTDGLDTINQTAATGTVAGNLTVSSGILASSSSVSSITITGTVSINGGTWTPGNITLTLNNNFTLSSGGFTGSTGSLDINGDLTVSGGVFKAISGTMTLSGNFNHSGGTFTHNSGTINLDGSNQTISGSTTFYNLTKNVTSAATLTFGAGDTQTIAATMNFQGAANQRLSLRSSSSGTQWKIDPQGSRTISYLDVKDSNNTNSTAIQTTNTNSVDSGNNTGWNFADPSVSSLGPSSLTDGSWTTDTTPTLTFTLSDSDTNSTIRFQIQIDDSSDFSSTVVDYTSALASNGSTSFTVGQSAGSGSYTTGSSSQTLSEGSYYWRVKAIDNNAIESSYSTANSGSVAFKIDTTAPSGITLDSPGDKTYIKTNRPTFRWKASTDSGSGISNYRLDIDNGTSGDFAIDNIPSSRTSSYETTQYTVGYENFSDSDSTNDYLSLYTKASTDWSSGANGGQLKEGKITWKITVYDNAGNTATASWVVYVDTTAPSLSGVSIGELGKKDGYKIITTFQPTISGVVTDNILPTTVEFTILRENYFVGILTSTSVHSTENHDLNNSAEALSVNFTYKITRALEYGKYQLVVKGKDKATNTSSGLTISLQVLPEDKARQLLFGEKKEDKERRSQISLPELEKKAKLRRKKEAAELQKFKESIIETAQELAHSAQNTLDSLIPKAQLIKDGVIETLTAISNATPQVFKNVSRITVVQPVQVVNRLNQVLIESQVKIKEKIVKTQEGTDKVLLALVRTMQDTTNSVNQILANSQDNIKTQIVGINRKNFATLLRTTEGLNMALIALYKPIYNGKNFAENIVKGTQVAIATFNSYVFDKEPTRISDVTIEEIGKDYAVISWKTNHPTVNNKLNFGTDLTYGQEVWSNDGETYHVAKLTNLKPASRYFFEVMSLNKNYAYDAYYSFETIKK